MENGKKAKKLLYVEDDIYCQNLVFRVLGGRFHLDMVPDAAAAFQKLATDDYDGMLIDINLGHGIDGAQLMERIKVTDHYKDKPLVAITAYAAHSDEEEFRARGFTHYLSKPFHLKDLIGLMEEIFGTGDE
ncbi:MAG: response regulator [Bacteroidetes bacterium]|nr:response regulator [Bacteroidota bacterium]